MEDADKLSKQLVESTQHFAEVFKEHLVTVKAWQTVQHLVTVRHYLKESDPIASAKKDGAILARGYRSTGEHENLALETEKIYDSIVNSLELMIARQLQSPDDDEDPSEELFPEKGLIH